MDLEGIILSEISQIKLNTVWAHSYMGFENKQTNKKKQLREQFAGRQGQKMGENGQSIQASSYQISKFGGCNG